MTFDFHAISCFHHLIVHHKHRCNHLGGSIKIEIKPKCFYYEKKLLLFTLPLFSSDFLHEFWLPRFFFVLFPFAIQIFFIAALHLILIHIFILRDATSTEAWINLFNGWLSNDEKPRFAFLVSPYLSLTPRTRLLRLKKNRLLCYLIETGFDETRNSIIV